MRTRMFALALTLALSCAAGAAAHAPRHPRRGGYGDWNGVASFRYTEGAGGASSQTGTDSRAYSVHGGSTATMTGSGQETVFTTNYCGPTSLGWNWNASGQVPAGVTVDDQTLTLSFAPLDATYYWHAGGTIHGEGICDKAIPTPDPTQGATGVALYSDNTPAPRSHLLRTSGSATVPASSIAPAASSGSLANAETTMAATWSLTRSGPDKDDDDLADDADPRPHDPDTDGDGYPDGWEVDHGTDPNDKHDHTDGPWHEGAPDSDGDGWSDPFEIQHGTDPADPESQPLGVTDSPPITHKPHKPKPPHHGGGHDQALVCLSGAPTITGPGFPGPSTDGGSPVPTVAGKVSISCVGTAYASAALIVQLRVQVKDGGRWRSIRTTPGNWGGLAMTGFSTLIEVNAPCEAGTQRQYRLSVKAELDGSGAGIGPPHGSPVAVDCRS